MSGLQALVPMMLNYAMHIQTILPYNIDQVSPLVCNCFYRLAVWLSGSIDVNAQSQNIEAIKAMKETLQKLGKRWMVAGIYQGILFGSIELIVSQRSMSRYSTTSSLHTLLRMTWSWMCLMKYMIQVTWKPTTSL
jgi:hypothetical protein